MKILFRHTRQPSPYADSIGKMVVVLDEGDDKNEVIEAIHSKNRWYEANHFEKEVNHYKDDQFDIKGRILIFNAIDGYTD